MAAAVFHVGLKLLLFKDNRLLVLTDTGQNRLDFPGGKITEAEQGVAQEDILKREVTEELGASLRYTIGEVAFCYRRYFHEAQTSVYLVFFRGEYRSGEIRLSSEHTSYTWTEPDALSEKDFSSEDREGYAVFRQYIDSLRNH